jgi:hypothetical protein
VVVVGVVVVGVGVGVGVGGEGGGCWELLHLKLHLRALLAVIFSLIRQPVTRFDYHVRVLALPAVFAVTTKQHILL